MLIIRHKRTKKDYRMLLEYCKIKVYNNGTHGEWVDGFAYYDPEDPSQLFARPLWDMEKFERDPDGHK